MTLEKILAVLEKYVGLDFLIMLFGLLYTSENGLRGYPFAWYGGNNSDSLKFLLSLAAVTAIVAAGDIITRIYIVAAEPVTKTQETIDQYSSSFTATVSETLAEPAADHRKRSITGKNDSSGSGNVSYEKRLQDDYQKVRKLLNGRDAGVSAEKTKNSASLGSIFTVIILISFVVFSCAAMQDRFGTGYESTEEYDDEIFTDDESYFDETVILENAEECLIYLQEGETVWFEDIANDDPQMLTDLTDWQNCESMDIVFTGFQGDTEPQSAVVRYMLETEDGYYLTAFKYQSDELTETSDPEPVGFALCKYPEEDGEFADEFGIYHLDESEYSADEFEEYTNQIEDSIISTGDCILDGVSILIW